MTDTSTMLEFLWEILMQLKQIRELEEKAAEQRAEIIALYKERNPRILYSPGEDDHSA